MPSLIIFVGPTRTASTSLFHWQRPQYTLTSYKSNRTYLISKSKSEEHYYFDPRYANLSAFDIQDYLNKFFNPQADIFIDYAPTFFHFPDYYSNVLTFLSKSFDSIDLICTVRNFADLCISTYSYNLRSEHPDFMSTSNKDILKYSEVISSHHDYFAFSQQLDPLIRSHPNTRLTYFKFSDIISSPNNLLEPILLRLAGSKPLKSFELYIDTHQTFNSSKKRFLLQPYYKFLSPLKPLLGPLFSKIRKYIPSVKVNLSIDHKNALLEFTKIVQINHSKKTETFLINHLRQ